jgi:PAS domain S-box-containing protein
MHAFRVIHPEYHHVFERFIKELNESGSFAGVTIDVRKDGSTFATDVIGSRITYKGKKCYLAVIRNATERAQAQQALADSEQQLSDIIEFLPDATFVIDTNGKLIAWNKAVEQMTGVKKEDMLGKSDYAHAVPFYGKPRPILIDLVLQRDKKWEQKYLNISEKDGMLVASEAFLPLLGEGGRYIAATASKLYDTQGKVVGAIESIRDVTDAKNTALDRERLIVELREALSEVKTLSGLLPICASCKKIRDDKGYWNQIESYIHEHSEAQFSHSICPDCVKELYPDMDVSKK